MRAGHWFGFLAAVLLLCSGCATWQAPVVPPTGIIVTRYKAPLTTEFRDAPVAGRVGSASTRFFNLSFLLPGMSFAWDDASIEKAAKEGDLTKVYYADYEVLSILGVFGTFTVTAHGE